jgi:hypothetical protein
LTPQIDRNFTECGNETTIPDFGAYGSSSTLEDIPTVAASITITKLESAIQINQHGYWISRGAASNLSSLYGQTQYIRSVFLTYESLGSDILRAGSSTSTSFNLT